nr:MAG TPA: hypothetical protein [Caudoviricetes sp.]
MFCDYCIKRVRERCFSCAKMCGEACLKNVVGKVFVQIAQG